MSSEYAEERYDGFCIAETRGLLDFLVYAFLNGHATAGSH